jgi:hypothetical protein
MSILQDIEQMQKKAGSYDMLLEEYNRLKDECREAIKRLNILIGSLDVSMKVKDNRRGRFSALMDRLYLKMKTEDGFFLTKKIISEQMEISGLPNDSGRVSDILWRMSKLSGVQKAGTHGNMELFYQKPASSEEKIKFGKTSLMG